MQAVCHRCEAELSGALTGLRQSSDDLALFCPRCGAPQLLLQEHMRIEDPAGQVTTGMLPPPRVGGTGRGEVDWRSAFRGASIVAVLGAALVMVGIRVNAVAFLGLCWVLSGAVISLVLYARQRPRKRVDGRIGLRIGVVAGLLMLGALGVAGAGTGVVLRFGTHGLCGFDERNAEQSKLAQAWAVRWMEEQHQDKEFQETYLRFVNSPLMTSPEMRAGTELAQFGVQGMLLLLVSAGSGALAGMVQRRRLALTRRD